MNVEENQWILRLERPVLPFSDRLTRHSDVVETCNENRRFKKTARDPQKIGASSTGARHGCPTPASFVVASAAV
jgi:hypothetical protein